MVRGGSSRRQFWYISAAIASPVIINIKAIMLRLPLLIVWLVCMAATLGAQNAAVVFYAEEGEPFYLELNGARQNEQPTDRIRVEQLPPGSYTAVIRLAQDAEQQPLRRPFTLMAGTEATYAVGRRNLSELEVELQSVGYELRRVFSDRSARRSYRGYIYTVRRVAEVQWTGSAPPPPPNRQAPPPPPDTRRCPVPMHEQDFRQALQTVKSRTNDDTRKQIAVRNSPSRKSFAWRNERGRKIAVV